MFEKGKQAGIETRGISDHGFIDSIYFRDPNGYVIELTAKRPDHDEQIAKARLGRPRPARPLAEGEGGAGVTSGRGAGEGGPGGRPHRVDDDAGEYASVTKM